MQQSCKYCGRIHPVGYICPAKPRRVWGRRDKRLDRFRRTVAWYQARDSALDRDYHLCRVCNDGKHGRYLTDRMEVHHIVPLVEDYSLRADIDNLVTLCHIHHVMAEKGEIGRGELRDIIKHPPRWVGS